MCCWCGECDSSRVAARAEGDVHLYLPADVSAHLRASTFSGSIRSDFGTVKDEDHGPGSSLDASIGSGDARVNVETFSGDLEIRRQ